LLPPAGEEERRMDAAQLKENVQEAGRSVQENLAEGIGRVQERMEERVRRGADQAQSMFASLNEEFGGFVREAPIMAIGGAFAVGYLVAKIARAFK
jgi:ElaB/YqjD/DUF883 family membrane-anchored ribosome-binding protein